MESGFCQDESVKQSSNFSRNSGSFDSKDTQRIPHGLGYRLTFLLFVTLGSGANWVLANALAQEIPIFERSSPQHLCIATYMNAATNFGLFSVIVYMLNNHYNVAIPHGIAVPSVLILGMIGAFLTAGTYSVTVNEIPILLLISCAIGGTVGALSAVVMTPFLMLYESDCISAARCGGSAGTLLTALVGLTQNPGSDHERFSPEVFFIIFGVLLCFPLLAYLYITSKGVGLRQNNIGRDCNDEIGTHNFTNTEIGIMESCNNHYPATDPGIELSRVRLSNEVIRTDKSKGVLMGKSGVRHMPKAGDGVAYKSLNVTESTRNGIDIEFEVNGSSPVIGHVESSRIAGCNEIRDPEIEAADLDQNASYHKERGTSVVVEGIERGGMGGDSVNPLIAGLEIPAHPTSKRTSSSGSCSGGGGGGGGIGSGDSGSGSGSGIGSSSSSDSSSGDSKGYSNPQPHSLAAVMGRLGGQQQRYSKIQESESAACDDSTSHYDLPKEDNKKLVNEQSHGPASDEESHYSTTTSSSNSPRENEACRCAGPNFFQKLSDKVIRTVFPCQCVDCIPWLRATLPYMLTVGWIDFNTWGMLSAVTPFAMANVSGHGGGAQNLALAYELGAVCMVLGDFSTVFVSLPFLPCLVGFTACVFFVYACAGGLCSDTRLAPLLVCVFAGGRFLESHLLTSSYRRVAAEMAVEHRESAARAVGLTDQLLTTLGTVLSTSLVSGLAKC